MNKNYHENLHCKISDETAIKFLEPLVEEYKELNMIVNLNYLTDMLVLNHDISALAARRMVDRVISL